MKHTRIEILKDGSWVSLLLRDNQVIRYNVVINKIGSMSNRDLSHSNTFELPYVHQNIQALGINIFNKNKLAKAFNSRYIARYYVKDKLTQKGYLIINNTENGSINVNFIDEALDIVDSWGSITYYELLNSKTINIPSDYRDAIKIMQSYYINQNSILTRLPIVSSRGYHLAKFPNNLNAIGEKFQLDKDGVRQIDSFNPYQSRPIFNVKALFDIAIESFGYTADYDKSVDWLKLSQTYMVGKDLSQNQKGDNTTVVKTYPTINNQSPAIYIKDFFLIFLLRTTFVYPKDVNAIYPQDLNPNFVLKDYFAGGWTLYKNYKKIDRCILIPDISVTYNGYMEWSWKGKFLETNTDQLKSHNIQAIWESITGVGYVTSDLTVDTYTHDEDTNIAKVKINKTQLITPPIGGFKLIGVVFDILVQGGTAGSSVPLIQNMVYTETFLPPNTISYDDFGQYEAFNIDLTHAAPRETVKDLLSAIMQKEGILISFDNSNKVIKLFTYGSYITRKQENKFRDWSKYLLKYMPISYNTDYGNEYAKKNEIGLESPFKGNTVTLELLNQGKQSKYKDFIQNLSKKFKDVENVEFIQNNNTPYFEYTNKGLGLVESPNSGLGTLRQIRADGASQGFFSGLAQVYNVNGLNLSNGILEWYDLIDNSVRVEAKFLIPTFEIRNLDMSEPIYVEYLGGFYIIEEIQEYIDAQTPVSIKLIKMIIPSISVNPEIDDDKYEHIYYDENFYE